MKDSKKVLDFTKDFTVSCDYCGKDMMEITDFEWIPAWESVRYGCEFTSIKTAYKNNNLNESYKCPYCHKNYSLQEIIENITYH